MRGQGAELPCGVWGNAPTVPRPTSPKEVANKGAGSEASLPVTLRIRRCAPKPLFPHLCCVAPDGRDRTAGLADHSGSFPKAGGSPLRRRGGGFAVAPSTPSQRTSMLLDFSRSRDFVSMLLDFFVAGASLALGTPQSPCTPFLWEAHLSAPALLGRTIPLHPPCKEVIA